MKKIMLVFLAVLCLSAFAAYAEEEEPKPGLFNLYAADGENAEWLGVAVSPYDGILVTAVSVMPQDLSHLLISDGVNVWDADAAAPDGSALAITAEIKKGKCIP